MNQNSRHRVRTLSNVRHIPNLKHNLITVCTLESNRCKYSTEGGVLEIFKGALLLMKGERYGSLYTLQGYTMTGSTTITIASSEEDVTRL